MSSSVKMPGRALPQLTMSLCWLSSTSTPGATGGRDQCLVPTLEKVSRLIADLDLSAIGR
ncbi:hypothetical protein ACFU44_21105 [Nocardia rhizosphaerihabitans]|uniref:hypothetical protein n=1 Tax=Nocardia rhizosphaerihabitans TaxID=1691570 RepID=UPI003670CA36